MTPKELYDYILTHMTAEEALLKLLEGANMKYKKIKENNLDDDGTPLHPLMIMSLAAMEMGWGFALKKGKPDEQVKGILVGTSEYMKSIDIKWKDVDGDKGEVTSSL